LAQEEDRIAYSRPHHHHNNQPEFRINNQIRVSQVRVIMHDGDNKGVLDTRDALDLARSLHMDLIEVAPNSNPPVCRIMDYGKFSYEKEKKDRAAKKSQKQIDVKGVQVRPKTTEHHLGFKIRAARRFLQSGNKVKVTLRFKGREMAHLHVARGMLSKVVEATTDLAYVETMPNIEGKTMLLILAPSQATLAAATLKSTQDRIEKEREADKAAGYDEDAEQTEHDDNEDEDNDAAVSAVDSTPQRAPTAEDKTRERKAISREKLAQKRASEQFGLP
jgi:translation initiation factor IF-3